MIVTNCHLTIDSGPTGDRRTKAPQSHHHAHGATCAHEADNEEDDEDQLDATKRLFVVMVVIVLDDNIGECSVLI